MNKDTVTTLAGGVLGTQMLTQINYSLLPQPWGELAKVVVAFGLMVAGYFMYRDKPAPNMPAPPGTTPTQVA